MRIERRLLMFSTACNARMIGYNSFLWLVFMCIYGYDSNMERSRAISSHITKEHWEIHQEADHNISTLTI
jgi:hypothetical protein